MTSWRKEPIITLLNWALDMEERQKAESGQHERVFSTAMERFRITKNGVFDNLCTRYCQVCAATANRRFREWFSLHVRFDGYGGKVQSYKFTEGTVHDWQQARFQQEVKKNGDTDTISRWM